MSTMTPSLTLLRYGSAASPVMWPLDSQYGFLQAVNLNPPCILHGCWVTEPQTFGVHDLDLLGVTWRHRSHDHYTHNTWFSIDDQFEPIVYLAQLSKYRTSMILGSWPWPFGVAWHHQLWDHWIRDTLFPIGDQFKQSNSHGCRDMVSQRFQGHDLHLLGTSDVISHVTIGLANLQYMVSYKWSCETNPTWYLARLLRCVVSNT